MSIQDMLGALSGANTAVGNWSQENWPLLLNMAGRTSQAIMGDAQPTLSSRLAQAGGQIGQGEQVKRMMKSQSEANKSYMDRLLESLRGSRQIVSDAGNPLTGLSVTGDGGVKLSLGPLAEANAPPRQLPMGIGGGQPQAQPTTGFGGPEGGINSLLPFWLAPPR